MPLVIDLIMKVKMKLYTPTSTYCKNGFSLGVTMMHELWTTCIIFVSSHYAKMWHPWLEHVRLLFQCHHVAIYALQLCDFYDYNHFHNYKTLHNYSHIFKLLCMPLTLFDRFFKIKNLYGGFTFANEKLLFTITKHNALILYIVIWLQLVLQCIIKF